jgi:hypothetical protein
LVCAILQPGRIHDERDHRTEPGGHQPGRGAADRAAARSLDGVTLGILNNSKPNSLQLQERVVELLAKQHSVVGVVTKQKPGAAIGSAFIPTFGTSKSVTRKIEMPR